MRRYISTSSKRQLRINIYVNDYFAGDNLGLNNWPTHILYE